MTCLKCKHQNCAVCSSLEQRDMLEHIFQKVNLDVYICSNIAYQVSRPGGKSFIIYNLNDIQTLSFGYYVVDLLTGKMIFITKENLSLVCKKDPKTCTVEPYIKIW